MLPQWVHKKTSIQCHNMHQSMIWYNQSIKIWFFFPIIKHSQSFYTICNNWRVYVPSRCICWQLWEWALKKEKEGIRIKGAIGHVGQALSHNLASVRWEIVVEGTIVLTSWLFIFQYLYFLSIWRAYFHSSLSFQDQFQTSYAFHFACDGWKKEGLQVAYNFFKLNT